MARIQQALGVLSLAMFAGLIGKMTWDGAYAAACSLLVVFAVAALFLASLERIGRRLVKACRRSTPPKPDLGPYAGPTVLHAGHFVKAGQARRDKQ